MSQPLSLSDSADEKLPAPPAPPGDSHWLRAMMPVVLIALCGELGISVLNNSALPVYFEKGLKIDSAVFGRIMVMFFVAEVLFKSPLGVLSDRWGRRPLMLVGALVTVFTPIMLIALRYEPGTATAVASLVAFGLLRGMDGLGQAALWPSLYAYVGDVVAEAKRGAAMGVLNVVYMVALALSFLAGGFVDDTFGPVFTGDVTLGRQLRHMGSAMGRHFHRHPIPMQDAVPINPVTVPAHYYPSFYLTTILFAVAVAATLFLRNRPGTSANVSAAEQGEKMSLSGFLGAVRTVPQFMGIAFVTFFGVGCISLLVKIFVLDEFGLTEKRFGQLTLAPCLLVAAVAYPAGSLADKWGKARSVTLGFTLSSLGLWAIPLLRMAGSGEIAFMAAASVIAVGFVVAFPAWLALLTTIGGEAQRGTVFAAVSTAQGVGMLAGALVGTSLYGHAGHLIPFWTAAVLVSAGTGLAFAFVRERAPSSTNI